MLCFRTICFSLLFLLTLSTFFSSSQSQQFHIKPNQDLIDSLLAKGGIVGEKRVANGSNSLVLAANRTRRRDPLNSFKLYTGGWNISDRHYWFSVGLTGAPLFITALVWFAIFGLSLSLICCCYFCCPREPYGYSRTAYFLSLIFLTLFTAASIIGCAILYTGQNKFSGSTKNTLEYVVKQSEFTVGNLRNVSGFLADAKGIRVASNILGPKVSTVIDKIVYKINSSATILEVKTKDNSKSIHDVLQIVRLCLIHVAAIMLLLTFLGFLFSLLGMQLLVSILVIIGWILVAVTFLLCGVFLVLHNAIADTCFAMDQWVHNPTAHTALDDILPCVDKATANESLLQSKIVSSQLIDVVNLVIATANLNLPPAVGPLLYNQSGPRVPLLCDPFNDDLSERACRTGELGFNNATQVLKNFVCQASSDYTCTTVGRLIPPVYSEIVAAVNVSFGLYYYGPYLAQLADCTFVRETFMNITVTYCPGVKHYIKWIYTGLVIVSVSVMLSLIFWVLYARERRHRAYTEHLLHVYASGTAANSSP